MAYIITAAGKRVDIPKYCPQCEREFYHPLEAFFKHPRKKDGLQSVCKSCMRANNRRYKQKERTAPEVRYGLQGAQLNLLVAVQIQHLQEMT
jgi:hypothetical protein